MRRISTVSAESRLHSRRDNTPQSVASCSWDSNSRVDLMLISRKRANSLGLRDPHPSTMLKAIDSPAFTIWDLSDPRSLRGKLRIPRRTLSASSCALLQTNNRRKSCMPTFSARPGETRRPFAAALSSSFPAPQLIATYNCLTDQLTTQDLDPLPQTSNVARRDSGRMR